MTESAVVQSWIEKATREKELQTRREDLIRVLERRFPGSVPPEVVETINAQPSVPMLRQWLDEAVTASTIDDFRAVLRR